jgi:hypothetical protein
MLTYFEGEILSLPDKEAKVRTQEGASAVQDALDFLENI